MRNFKIFLIAFLVFILLGAGFLFLYKNNLANIMQERVSLSDEFLLNSSGVSRNIKASELETEFLGLSKYKKLDVKVPQDFVNKKVEVGRATSSSNYVKQLIFLKSQTP